MGKEWTFCVGAGSGSERERDFLAKPQRSQSLRREINTKEDKIVPDAGEGHIKFWGLGQFVISVMCDKDILELINQKR